MAIQVWDGTKYVGAELGRFGESGTLAEALVWDSAAGQYVKVWPTTPAPLWEDDFTSPTLHERWTLLDGEYNPPGLAAVVSGPTVSDAAFELTVTRGGTGTAQVMAMNFATFQSVTVVSTGGAPPYMMDSTVGAPVHSPVTVPDGARFGLRRAAGQWHLVVDEAVVASMADNHSAPLVAALFGAPDAPITSVSYTEL
jgi:hypothetical protein